MVTYIFTFKEGGNFFSIFPYRTLDIDSPECQYVKSIQVDDSSNVFLYGPLSQIADLACYLNDCNLYIGISESYNQLEEWAFVQIRLFALGKNIKMITSIKNLSSIRFDAIVLLTKDWSIFSLMRKKKGILSNVENLYKSLVDNGKMYIRTSEEPLYGDGYQQFKDQLISDRSLASISMFQIAPDIFSVSKVAVTLYEILIEKSGTKEVVMRNLKGESCEVKHKDLDQDILLPSYYLTSKPTEGTPLSDLVEFAKPMKSIDIDIEQLLKAFNCRSRNSELPNQDLAVVTSSDLTESYPYADLAQKALRSRSYYQEKSQKLRKSGEYENTMWPSQVEYTGPIVFFTTLNNVVKVGYITQESEMIVDVTDDDYLIRLAPKSHIVPQYIAAVLLSKQVSSVLLSICDGNVSSKLMKCLLSKIYVSEISDLDRYRFMAETNGKAMEQLLEEQKRAHEHYVKAVRMRKHALSQSFSAMEAMFFALNNYRERKHGIINDVELVSRIRKTTVKDAFEFLSENFKEMGIAIEHIADINYSFGRLEWIDPELFIENYINQNSNGWLNFKAVTSWKHGDNQLKNDLKDPETNRTILPKGASLVMFYFPQKALEHVFNNILSNARSHGFKDKERNDYQILFSWKIERDVLIIEIANNGTPISSEMDTDFLLEYGVSSALHQDGHNGIGCHEIDAIMKEYDGRVRVVSEPTGEYTVKYVLSFNHIHIEEINL